MANPPTADALVGMAIAERYRIISRIGAGGMGIAYRAWDRDAGIPVVIKTPKRSCLDDPRFKERFARETRLLQALDHPHVVPIRDMGEHEGLPYVVMRFLPGGSLSNRRLRDEHGKPRANPPGMLHFWLPAVASALDHIHARGIVHRDVKPGNIFFDAFWGAFVGDFGIAKIVEDTDGFEREQTLTATGMVTGTPEYMAPERFTPRATIDGRADQYALAVMVYELLSGTRPFRGESSHLIVEVLTQPPPPVESINPPTSPRGASHLARALRFLPKMIGLVKRYKTSAPRINSTLAVHGLAAERSTLLSSIAPTKAPTAPGTATLTSACQSTFLNRMCAAPEIEEVTISTKCTMADAAAGL
jgi:serine/threonine-protein kinase